MADGEQCVEIITKSNLKVRVCPVGTDKVDVKQVKCDTCSG